MIQLKSQIYQCEQCKKDNDIEYNKGREIVNGTMCQTRECYYCKHKYIYHDNCLFSIPGIGDHKPSISSVESEDDSFKSKSVESHKPSSSSPELESKSITNTSRIDNTSRNSSKPEGDSFTSTILQYIGIGIVLVGLLGGAISYLNKARIVETVMPVAEVASPQYTPPIQTVQPLKKVDCNFEGSRDKALAKLKSLNLSFVDDQYSPDESNVDCSIKFHFYVKRVAYDLEGNSYLEDKLYDLQLTYKKIGRNFEFIDGKLFVNSTQYQSLN
ncbi:hypothetical protein [Pedobacter sp. JCM 36344]|uniref:hypothetical protein n=1 Tax=Pedobacter sp. JCM 36344 TaxID=3374280 RepID=UPI00397803D1